MKIAVLGMGRMGRAVAGRLLDGGHDLAIWNRTPGRAPELVERGATEAQRVAEAVDGVALVVTSLANDAAVRAVALGDGGVRASAGRGMVYVDSSTSSPELDAELEAAFDAFAAMPILGNPDAVAAGAATYLLGGPPEARRVVDQVLPDLTDTVHRYDHPALAATAKLASNLLLVDAVVALAESFAAGRAGGLSEDQLRELLADSPMVALGIRNRFEGVLTGDHRGWWSPGLGAKDAGLALDLAREAGIELPATAAVRGQLERTAATGDPDDDLSAVGRLYRAG